MSTLYDEVERIENAKSDIADAIRAKGVDVTENIKFSEYPNVINNINIYDTTRMICALSDDGLVSYSYSINGYCNTTVSDYSGVITNISLGNNVVSMSKAFYNCVNLICSPVCHQNITDMSYAYYNCQNLTGVPVCGNNVVNLAYAYYNCQNLTSSDFYYPNNILDINKCFYGCINLGGNHYLNNCTDLSLFINESDPFGFDLRTEKSSRLNIFTNMYSQSGFYMDNLILTSNEPLPGIYNYCYHLPSANCYIYSESEIKKSMWQ